MNRTNILVTIFFFILSILFGYYTLEIPFFANDYSSAIVYYTSLSNNSNISGLFSSIGDGHRYRPLYILLLSIVHLIFNDNTLIIHYIGALTIYFYSLAFYYLLVQLDVQKRLSFYISLFNFGITVSFSEFLNPFVGNLMGTCLVFLSLAFYTRINPIKSLINHFYMLSFIVLSALSFFTIWSMMIFLPVIIFIYHCYYSSNKYQLLSLIFLLPLFIFPAYCSIGGFNILSNSPLFDFNSNTLFKFTYYFIRSSELPILFIGMPAMVFMLYSSFNEKSGNILFLLLFCFLLIISMILQSLSDIFSFGVLFGNSPINTPIISILSALIMLILFFLNIYSRDKITAFFYSSLFSIIFLFPFLVYSLTRSGPPIMGLYYTPLLPLISFLFINSLNRVVNISYFKNFRKKYILMTFLLLTLISSAYYVIAISFNYKEGIYAISIVDNSTNEHISRSVRLSNSSLYEIYFGVTEYIKMKQITHQKTLKTSSNIIISENYNLNWFFMPYARNRVDLLTGDSFLLLGRERPLSLSYATYYMRFFKNLFNNPQIAYPYSELDEFLCLWFLTGSWLSEPEDLPGEYYLNNNSKVIFKYEVDFEKLPLSAGEALFKLLKVGSISDRRVIYSSLYFIEKY